MIPHTRLTDAARGPIPGLSWLGSIAATAGVLALAVTFWQTAPVIATLTSPSAGVAPEDLEAKQLQTFDESMRIHVARVDGRSLFFVPPRPRPPRPPDVDSGPVTPSKPTVYGGPAIIAMINGKVWLADGQRLAAGESGSGGLKVVELAAPWWATINWEGVDFKVDLFQQSKLLHADVKPTEPPAEKPTDPTTPDGPAESAAPSTPSSPGQSEPGSAPPGPVEPSPEAPPAPSPEPAPEPDPAPSAPRI